MANDTYEEVLPKTMPPWGQGLWGKRYGESVGRRMDVIVDRYKQAVFARLPGLAPADALPVIGRDRQLPRGPGEPQANYVARNQRAWEIWGGDNTPLSGAGGGAASHLGMLLGLQAAGLPTGPTGATIVQQNLRYAQLDISGNLVLGTLLNCVNRKNILGAIQSRPGWSFDGRDNFWSVFGIVFPAPATVDAAALNAVVAKWRPSKALFIGTWVIHAGRLLGWPVGARTLATEPVLGGNTITFHPGPTGDHQRIGYAP